MPFPPAFIDEVIARNPIEDVVGQYVTLKRSGSNLFGLCPFHGEKTASFSVAPDKGMFYCFGCHKGGGVINFEMEIEGLSYGDAVRALAKRAGLEVPEDEQPQTPEPPVVERDKAKVRALTREERELYAPFIQSKSAREQLVKAIDNISLAAYTGNVIITGEEGMDPGDSGYRQQFLRKSCQNLRPCAEQKRCSRDPEQTAERCTYHL